MIKVFKIAAVLYAISTIIACEPDGPVVTETISLAEFQEIELSNSADVNVYQGESFKADITDYEQTIRHLKLEVVGNKLKIKSVGKSLWNAREKVDVYMNGPLKSIVVDGSGDVRVNDHFDDIEILKVSGSGNISFNSFQNLENIKAMVHGSGDIKISNGQCKTANCDVSGSGNIVLRVSDVLHANISGSGNIEYYGEPQITKKITGSGDLKKK